MGMTRETSELFREYGRAKESVRTAVDEATEEMLSVLKRHGLIVAGDDRCAHVEATIYGFVKASGNDVCDPEMADDAEEDEA